MHGLYHAFLPLLYFRLETGHNTMAHIVPCLQYVVCNRYSAAHDYSYSPCKQTASNRDTSTYCWKTNRNEETL